MRSELKEAADQLRGSAASVKAQLTEALAPYKQYLDGKSVSETVEDIFGQISKALGGEAAVAAVVVSPKAEPEVRAAAPAPQQDSTKPLKPFPADHGVGCAKCGEEAPTVKFNVDGEGKESLLWSCEDGCGAVYSTLCRDA